MPFAGYDDFDACVRENSDKRDPEAYCAAIKREVEGDGALSGDEREHYDRLMTEPAEDHRALASFHNPAEIRRVEGAGDEVTYKRVMLLSPGMWADAGSKTFVDYNADAIRQSADNWVDLDAIRDRVPEWPQLSNEQRAERLAELGDAVMLEDAAPVNFLHGPAMYGADSLDSVGDIPLDSIIVDDDGRMYGDLRLHGDTPQSQTAIDLMDEVLQAVDNGERDPPPVGPSVEIPADMVTHTDGGLQLERAFYSAVGVVFNPASRPVELGEQARERAVAMSAPGTVDGMDAQGMVYRSAGREPDPVARVRALQARVRRLKRYA